MSAIVPAEVPDAVPPDEAPGEAAGVVLAAEEPFVEELLEVTSVGGVELASGCAPQPVMTKASRVSDASTTTIERMGLSPREDG
jgi:hypothetical protein